MRVRSARIDFASSAKFSLPGVDEGHQGIFHPLEAAREGLFHLVSDADRRV
jgi:hypothetical protein